MRAGDNPPSTLRRPPAYPGLVWPACPTRVPNSGLWAPLAEAKARPEGLPGGYFWGGKPECGGASAQKRFPPAYTQAERAREDRGPGGGGGPGWLILSREAWEGESIPSALRHPPQVSTEKLSRKDAAKVSWGAEARRASRAERPSSWPTPEPRGPAGPRRCPLLRPARPASGPLRAPVSYPSLGFSEEPHPTSAGQAAGSFQTGDNPSSSSLQSAKEALGFPAGELN